MDQDDLKLPLLSECWDLKGVRHHYPQEILIPLSDHLWNRCKWSLHLTLWCQEYVYIMTFRGHYTFFILDESGKQVLLNEENFIHLLSPEKYKIWIKQTIPWATGYILSSFEPCSFCIHLNFKHVTSGTGLKAIITTGKLQGQKASWGYLRSCLKNKNVRNTLEYISRLDILPTMYKDQD